MSLQLSFEISASLPRGTWQLRAAECAGAALMAVSPPQSQVDSNFTHGKLERKSATGNGETRMDAEGRGREQRIAQDEMRDIALTEWRERQKGKLKQYSHQCSLHFHWEITSQRAMWASDGALTPE